MTSVRDLIAETQLALDLVIAGDVDRTITWIAPGAQDTVHSHAGEGCLVVLTPSPDSSEDCEPGDSAWHDLVAGLTRARIAALAVQSEHLAQPLVHAAASFSLTLMRVPLATDVAQLSRTLHQLQVRDQLHHARAAIDAQQRLLDLAHTGATPAGIVAALSGITGRHTALLSAEGEEIAATQGFLASRNQALAPHETQRLEIGDGRELVAFGGPLDPDAAGAFTSAAMVLSFEGRNDLRNTVIERERWGRVTKALVTGDPRASAMCEVLDPSLRLPHEAHVLVVQGAAETVASWRAEPRSDALQLVTRYPLAEVPARAASDAQHVEHAGISTAWQVVSPADLEAALTSANRFGLDVIVGVLTPVAHAAVSRRSAEALLTRLSPSQQLYQEPRTPATLYAQHEAPVLSLLATLPRPIDITRAVLGPLSVHADPTDHELRATLTSLIEHHGQRGPAAAALGIHRNTLRGRIERIEVLTGRFIDNPDDRAELWIALRTEGE